MKSILSVLILVCSVPAFASHGGGSSVGEGNPAAANCLRLGGQLEAVQTAAGDGSNCAVEEWDLFRAMSDRGLLTPHQYGPMGMPNPAAVNCIDIKGDLRSVKTEAGEDGQCVVEEWALFHVINVVEEQ